MEEGWRRDGGGQKGQKGQERQERQGGGRMSVKCSLFGRARETLPIGAWGPASLPPSTNDLPYRAEEYEKGRPIAERSTAVRDSRLKNATLPPVLCRRRLSAHSRPNRQLSLVFVLRSPNHLPAFHISA
jgi:hypothetical protein